MFNAAHLHETAHHDGAPTVTIFKTRRSKARKDHMCDMCRCPIVPGSEYQSTTGTEDGKFFVQREHYPRCPSEPIPCKTCGATGEVFMEMPSRADSHLAPCPHCAGRGYFEPLAKGGAK